MELHCSRAKLRRTSWRQSGVERSVHFDVRFAAALWMQRVREQRLCVMVDNRSWFSTGIGRAISTLAARACTTFPQVSEPYRFHHLDLI